MEFPRRFLSRRGRLGVEGYCKVPEESIGKVAVRGSLGGSPPSGGGCLARRRPPLREARARALEVHPDVQGARRRVAREERGLLVSM